MIAHKMLTPKKFIGPKVPIGRIPSSLRTSITARTPSIIARIAKNATATGQFIISSNIYELK
jgi:hypothetical protein